MVSISSKIHMALLRDLSTKYLNEVYEQQVAPYSVAAWTQKLPKAGLVSITSARTFNINLDSQEAKE